MDKSELAMDDTVRIISAYVSHNAIQPRELPELISSVHAKIVDIISPAPAMAVPEALVPAVSVRASVKPDHLTCLECGVKAKMLKRHLRTAHGLDEAEYRSRWNLPADYPLVAPNYSSVRRELAMNIGLGRKPGAKK